MRILLISPNTHATPYPVYPLGLDYVAGSLDPRHELRRFDRNCGSLDDLAQVLDEFAPEIVGVSCRNIDNTEAGAPLYFLRQYRDLIDRIRARCPAPVVCGGSGFTIMPEAAFAELGADWGIIGEGERFGLLVEALERGEDPADIPGVIGKKSPPHVPPPPPWPGERKRRLAPQAPLDFYSRHGGMLNLHSKPGCAFRCVYCPYPHIEGHRHRLEPPEQVADTALALERAGAKYLFITDSAFNSDVAHSLAVARAFADRGLKIPWGAFFAPLKPASGYFATMAEAGCRHVEFGTESLSPRMLANFRKPFTVEDVFAAHEQARAAGLHTAHYFLLGGPGETEATAQESLANVERIQGAAFFFFVGVRIYPGAELHRIALARGKIDEHANLLEPVFYENAAVSRERLETLVTRQARGRLNWLVGSGGEAASQIVARLHARGRTGPLWEHLAR